VLIFTFSLYFATSKYSVCRFVVTVNEALSMLALNCSDLVIHRYVSNALKAFNSEKIGPNSTAIDYRKENSQPNSGRTLSSSAGNRRLLSSSRPAPGKH
jgi:hypothetical protein